MENQGDILRSKTALGGISGALLSEIMEYCCRSKEDSYITDQIKIEEDSSKSSSIEPSILPRQCQPIANNKSEEVLNLDLVDNEITFPPHPPHRNSMAAIPPHQPYVNLNFGQHRLDPGTGNFYPQPQQTKF
ncbi:hypothetical protein BTUL_0009g00160 [Botrytis tulipae]|uniref:Uncharacterized protein n=1 Tax=Botrytis tulipae TaxID=87230 RepID=A0A4Z1F4L4_9HELO|nr:hypothetical protein BTUL_0009g00160 [Botrytis tulipae]